MNPLKILGVKTQKKEASKSSGKPPRSIRSGDSHLRSSTGSASSSGRRTQKSVTRSRSGSHNHKTALMHPTDLIAMLEQRASLTGDMDSAALMFEQIKMGSGEFSVEFEADSDTES
jgi:hypothetical protein